MIYASIKNSHNLFVNGVIMNFMLYNIILHYNTNYKLTSFKHNTDFIVISFIYFFQKYFFIDKYVNSKKNKIIRYCITINIKIKLVKP